MTVQIEQVEEMYNLIKKIFRCKKEKRPITKSVSLSFFVKRLDYSLTEVKEITEILKEQRRVKTGFVMYCENENCLKTITRSRKKEELPQEYTCKYCGEEVEEQGYIEEVIIGVR